MVKCPKMSRFTFVDAIVPPDIRDSDGIQSLVISKLEESSNLLQSVPSRVAPTDKFQIKNDQNFKSKHILTEIDKTERLPNVNEKRKKNNSKWEHSSTEAVEGNAGYVSEMTAVHKYVRVDESWRSNVERQKIGQNSDLTKEEDEDLTEPCIEFIQVKVEPIDYGDTILPASLDMQPIAHSTIPEPGFCMTLPLKFHKKTSAEAPSRPKSLELSRKSSKSPRVHRCEECGLVCETRKLMNKHALSHRGDQPKIHSCECGKTYKSYTGLWKHRRSVHEANHEGEKSYACDKCGKWFKGTRYLKVHYLSHTGEKPHLCQFCHKSFRHQSTLNRHVRIHTGVKPYRCHLCPQSFTDSGSLKWHVRKHTGERPHVCAICGNAYAHSTNLRRHLQSHLAGRELRGEGRGGGRKDVLNLRKINVYVSAEQTDLLP